MHLEQNLTLMNLGTKTKSISQICLKALIAQYNKTLNYLS